MPKQFQRTIEDFTCEYCGLAVVGIGYTNHCPECLYSKHVDINPGDRMAHCGGLMEPISVESKGQEYVIVHRCQECGLVRKNKSVASDNHQALINLVKKI